MLILLVEASTYSDGLQEDNPAFIWATPTREGYFGERYILDFEGSGINADTDPESVDESCTLPVYPDLLTVEVPDGNSTGNTRRRHLLSSARRGTGGMQQRLAVHLHNDLPDGRRVLREEHPPPSAR